MKTCKSGLHQYEPIKGCKTGCPECKKARKIKQELIRRNKYPEKIKEQNKKYRENHPDRYALSVKKAKEKNPELYREKNRIKNIEWRSLNKEKIQESRFKKQLEKGLI